MAYHPVNLTVRFALELAALAALGSWAWQAFPPGWRLVAAAAVPLAAAAVWGTFAVPGDASRSGHAPIEVPGALRLGLELALFALASWALAASGRPVLAGVLVGAASLHYLVSLERVTWLLGR